MSFTAEEKKEIEYIRSLDLPDQEKEEFYFIPLFEKITKRLTRENELSQIVCELKRHTFKAIEVGMSKEDIIQLYNEVLVAYVMEK